MPSLIIDILLNQQVSALSEIKALTDIHSTLNKSQNKSIDEARQELIAEYLRCHPLARRGH